MGWTGPTELIIPLLLVVFLLFGAKRLPELARSIGKSLGEFKKGTKEIVDEIDSVKEATNDEDSPAQKEQ